MGKGWDDFLIILFAGLIQLFVAMDIMIKLFVVCVCGSCLCRRLGERESEEVGSSSISLMDLWQLNGSEVSYLECLSVRRIDLEGVRSTVMIQIR